MLSTSTNSSITKRRQLHRRQQSLEAPILTTPIPANHHHLRRPATGHTHHHGHRRGHSFDQAIHAQLSPSGFRPLHPQDQFPIPGNPSVRIDTNIGNPELQHFKQDTQQHMPSQPGLMAPDFQSHLQQQLKGAFNAQTPQQRQALQELQHHMEWYSSTYGSSPNQGPATPLFDMVDSAGPEMPGASIQIAMPVQTPINGMPTPVSSRTMPNTPQTFTQGWPSPPPSEAKQVRSQSFQLDIAPMPGSLGAGVVAGLPSSAYGPALSSPIETMMMARASHMPTLFEETTPPMMTMSGLQESSLLLQATSGAVQDFNSPNFEFGQAPIAMSSPRQALLNSLGPDMPASIVETGIPAHEIAQFIGDFNESDKKYPCLFQGCNKKFGRKENVRAHVQTHLGDRQFKCDLCDKTFVRQHDLKRHIAIHSDDRPHSCVCGQSFARHDALTRHRQRGMCAGALPGYEKDPEDLPKRGRPKKERPNNEERTDKSSKQRRLNKQKADEQRKSTRNSGAPGYASSSYSASDRSFPVTPPDTSDAFEVDNFLSMTGGEQFRTAAASWRDTPPTSPVSASPTKTVDSLDPRGQLRLPVQDHGISPAMLSNHSSPIDRASQGESFEHGSSPPTQIFDHSSPAASDRDRGSFAGGSSPEEYNIFSDAFEAVNAQPDSANHMFSPPGESHTNSSVYNYSDHEPRLFEKEMANVSSITPDNLFDDIPGDDFASNDMADILNSWLTAS